jgi:hypothetical protein
MARKRRLPLRKRVEASQGSRTVSQVLNSKKVFRCAKGGHGKADAVIVLSRNPKHNAKAFEKKMNKLMDLGKQGKLKKQAPNRNGAAQKAYRDQVQSQIDNITDTQQRQRLQDAFDSMDADHIHELQASGLDVADNLWLLDGGVNSSVGAQIMNRLKHLNTGETFQIYVDRW